MAETGGWRALQVLISKAVGRALLQCQGDRNPTSSEAYFLR